MSDSHAANGHGVKPYLVVFGALTVFTTISFVVYEAFPRGSVAPFVIILAVAVCKALLVAAYFMHLISDWGKVFIMIVPALILGPMFMVVLLPDIVLQNKNDNVPQVPPVPEWQVQMDKGHH